MFSRKTEVGKKRWLPFQDVSERCGGERRPVGRSGCRKRFGSGHRLGIAREEGPAVQKAGGSNIPRIKFRENP